MNSATNNHRNQDVNYYCNKFNLYVKYPKIMSIHNNIIINQKVIHVNNKKRKKKKKKYTSYYRTDEIPVYLEALKKLNTKLDNKIIQTLYSKNPLRNKKTYGFSLINNKFNFHNLPNAVDAAVPDDRKKRKREQIINMMILTIPFLFDDCIVCDFASGSGHQSIPLAYHFPKCNFILIDMKQKSLQIAEERCKRLGLKNVTFYHGKIEEYDGKFDVGMSLHACGVATDLAFLKCFEQSAVCISCPCCIGKVVLKDNKYKNNVKTSEENAIEYPKSTVFQNILTKNEYHALASAGDFGGHDGIDETTIGNLTRSENFKSIELKDNSNSRRICKSMVELDRILHAREEGNDYQTWMFTLEPKSCTPKNDIIICAKKLEDKERFKNFLLL